MVAYLVDSLLEDRRVAVVPLSEDQTLAVDHQSTAFVKHPHWQVDQELELPLCLAVVVADHLEEWLMNCRAVVEVQDRQASELVVVVDPMPAVVAEMLKHYDLKLVQDG